MTPATDLTFRAALDPHLRHEEDGVIVLAQWEGPPGDPGLRWIVLKAEPGGRVEGQRDLSLDQAHVLIDLYRRPRPLDLVEVP